MAKEYDVPGLPEALGIAISVKPILLPTGGSDGTNFDEFIRIIVRNEGAGPMRVTFTVEGRKRGTGEVRKTHTLRHGRWSEMNPGKKRSKDILARNLTWFLTSVEVERGGRIQHHDLEHQIGHTQGKGCAAKVVVPSVVVILGGVLAGFWWG